MRGVSAAFLKPEILELRSDVLSLSHTNRPDSPLNPPLVPLRKQKQAPLAHTSVVTRALALVTLTPSCFALAMISILFRDETAWPILSNRRRLSDMILHEWMMSLWGRGGGVYAYSAAKVLLCMSRRLTSLTFCTKKALCPDGIMCRVFLLLP